MLETEIRPPLRRERQAGRSVSGKSGNRRIAKSPPFREGDAYISLNNIKMIMIMNRNIRQTLLAPVVLLLAAALGMAGCTADDDFSRLPQGSIPLRVGDVTVAGMKPGTRAAGGNASTRAVVSETPATGYTGIRKSRFVDGDVLNLTLSNDGGGTNTPVTATLTGGAWVLSEKAYVISGTTTILATHAGTEVTVGIKPDALEADTYTLAGEKVTFSMKHANAMIDITLPAGSVPTGVTITSITLAAHNGTTDEALATVVEEEMDGNHYRTIALPGIVKSLTAVINGQSYMATLATPLTVEANKRYPVSLTFKENKLTATVGAASTNWGAGATINVVPAGYTRVIRTPEDLAQLAKDVNDDAAGARTAVVLQTADLDMSQLKPTAEAGINPLTGTAYTYTATADAWVPIGNSEPAAFRGKYNGDGRTISNLKVTTGEYSGLWGYLSAASLTGIHLRDFTANGSKGGGALASQAAAGSVIALCSATGTLTTNGSYHHSVGGFIGVIDASTVTRCSADVDVTMNGAGYNELGGFIGKGTGSIIAGCSATADIAWNSSSESVEKISGFIGWLLGSKVFGCYGNGTMQDATHAAFAMYDSNASGNAAISCYSTVEGGFFINVQVTITDCAYAHTDVPPSPPTPAITGVTSNVTPATAYATLTASTATTSLADVKTLHWSTADGYTLTPVTSTWDSDAIWKDNGTAAPTLDLAYEGWDGLYEGTTPNLLEITQTAYYVAPVNAKNDLGYQDITWVEAMAAGVCPKGWHVPTKDDFMAMTGTPADGRYYSGNHDAIVAVFPADVYWASTELEDDDAFAYILVVHDDARSINVDTKNVPYSMRCVRKK